MDVNETNSGDNFAIYTYIYQSLCCTYHKLIHLNKTGKIKLYYKTLHNNLATLFNLQKNLKTKTF